MYVNTYIYSLLIKKNICNRRNISVKPPCVCVCLSSGDIFIFALRISCFFSYFFVKFRCGSDGRHTWESICIQWAFCNTRKHHNHWICAVHLLHARVFKNLSSIGQEGSSKEQIHKEYISNLRKLKHMKKSHREKKLIRYEHRLFLYNLQKY